MGRSGSKNCIFDFDFEPFLRAKISKKLKFHRGLVTILIYMKNLFRSAFSRRSLLSRSSTKFSFRSFRDRTSSNQSNHPVELQSLSNPATPTERIRYIGSNQKEEQEKKRIQTVKLTMTIVIAHFVLWAPFCIVNVIDAFAPHSIS